MELTPPAPAMGQRAAIVVNECPVSCKIHVLNLVQGDQKVRRLFEDQLDWPHPGPDRPTGRGKAPDRNPVLVAAPGVFAAAR
jgi:hypothetical protein